MKTTTSTPTDVPQSNTGMLASPDLNPDNIGGREPARAIRDEKQAEAVVVAMQESNRRRHTTAKRILERVNVEKPFDGAKMKNDGLGWMANFTTRPLATLVDRVSPRYAEVINNMKYLTDAQLPASVSGSTFKSEFFQRGFTDLVRGHPSYSEFLDLLTLEFPLFGYSIVSWLDEFEWFPQLARFEATYVPDKCPQTPAKAQVVVLREELLQHELYELISKQGAAEAGWNVSVAAEAINKASPDIASKTGDPAAPDIWLAHAHRELNVGSSYTTAASTVVLYSLLVREISGKVSHYRLTTCGSSMRVVFTRHDRFPSMEEVFGFFSAQVGNGTLPGSRGMGRDLYAIAGAQDRARCDFVNRAWLAGKLVVQGDPRQVQKFSMSVLGGFLLIPEGWAMMSQRFDSATEGAKLVDDTLQAWMDGMVGSVSPRFLQGERVTAKQVELFASREEESRDVRLSRFVMQFSRILRQIQRRLCRKSVTDPRVEEFRKLMLTRLSEEEFKQICEAPVASAIADFTPEQRQLIINLATEKKGHPLYDQAQLERQDVTARLGADFADSVLLPQPDPTVVTEQARLQMMEIMLLERGEPVPVSPRDNAVVHLQVLGQALQNAMQLAAQGQVSTSLLEGYFVHGKEHVGVAEQAGVDLSQVQEVVNQIVAAEKVIDELKMIEEQEKKVAAATGQAAAEIDLNGDGIPDSQQTPQ